MPVSRLNVDNIGVDDFIDKALEIAGSGKEIEKVSSDSPEASPEKSGNQILALADELDKIAQEKESNETESLDEFKHEQNQKKEEIKKIATTYIGLLSE